MLFVCSLHVQLCVLSVCMLIYIILFCLCVTLCCSVAFQSASSCLEDLDESRSLQLKDLLSEYFDKRRDRSQALAPVDFEELDKYKVKHTTDIRSYQLNLCLDIVVYLCVCSC